MKCNVKGHFHVCLDRVILTSWIFFLQWIVPAVSNSLKPLNELEFPRMAERLLKLAVSI